jgi:hypothetical protein
MYESIISPLISNDAVLMYDAASFFVFNRFAGGAAAFFAVHNLKANFPLSSLLDSFDSNNLIEIVQHKTVIVTLFGTDIDDPISNQLKKINNHCKKLHLIIKSSLTGNKNE